MSDRPHPSAPQPSTPGAPAGPQPPGWPAVVDGVRAGEPVAVDAWYRSDWPPVYRLCLGFLADHAEAEDAAQDAMLRIEGQLDRWDRTRPYAAWRATVALNLCRDRLRRRDARTRAEDAAQPLPQRLPRPDDTAMRGEVRAAIEAALAHLPEREREAFVLRDLEAYDTDTVAQAMGIGASTVRSLLTLARRRLRTLLAPHLPAAAGAPGELDAGGAA